METGSEPGEQRSGTANTFDQARAAFEKAWQVFAANRTESDYQAYGINSTGPRENCAIDRGEKVGLR